MGAALRSVLADSSSKASAFAQKDSAQAVEPVLAQAVEPVRLDLQLLHEHLKQLRPRLEVLSRMKSSFKDFLSLLDSLETDVQEFFPREHIGQNDQADSHLLAWLERLNPNTTEKMKERLRSERQHLGSKLQVALQAVSKPQNEVDVHRCPDSLSRYLSTHPTHDCFKQREIALTLDLYNLKQASEDLGLFLAEFRKELGDVDPTCTKSATLEAPLLAKEEDSLTWQKHVPTDERSIILEKALSGERHEVTLERLAKVGALRKAAAEWLSSKPKDILMTNTSDSQLLPFDYCLLSEYGLENKAIILVCRTPDDIESKCEILRQARHRQLLGLMVDPEDDLTEKYLMQCSSRDDVARWRRRLRFDRDNFSHADLRREIKQDFKRRWGNADALEKLDENVRIIYEEIPQKMQAAAAADAVADAAASKAAAVAASKEYSEQLWRDHVTGLRWHSRK
jgi:hypothetical protein